MYTRRTRPDFRLAHESSSHLERQPQRRRRRARSCVLTPVVECVQARFEIVPVRLEEFSAVVDEWAEEPVPDALEQDLAFGNEAEVDVLAAVLARRREGVEEGSDGGEVYGEVGLEELVSDENLREGVAQERRDVIDVDGEPGSQAARGVRRVEDEGCRHGVGVGERERGERGSGILERHFLLGVICVYTDRTCATQLGTQARAAPPPRPKREECNPKAVTCSTCRDRKRPIQAAVAHVFPRAIRGKCQ